MSFDSALQLGASCDQSIEYDRYPTKMVSVPTMKERIKESVKAAEVRLAALREAEEIFNRNPDIERLLDIMQRGNF